MCTWKLGATVGIVGILMGKHGVTVTIINFDDSFFNGTAGQGTP